MKRVLSFETALIGVGANLVSSCLSWAPSSVGSDSLAAFGAGSCVALFSLEKNAIIATFCASTGGEVNKVRWLDHSTLFACTNKGLLVVELDAQGRLDKAKTRFEAISISVEQQFHGLCLVPDARGKGESLVVLSGTHVVSFVFCAKMSTCVMLDDPIPLVARQLSECVSGSLLPRSKIAIVAVGGADRRVHLYVDEERKVCVCVCVCFFFFLIFFKKMQGLQYVAWIEGHQDWIRDLSFCEDGMTGDVLLASASSDTFVRLWRISRREQHVVATNVLSSVQEAESRQKIAFVVRDDSGNAPVFAVALDALFVGHSHFVHSVAWSRDGKHVVSASMDKTMIVWEKDPDEVFAFLFFCIFLICMEKKGVWVDKFRVGEIGGNSLGFYGASFSPDGDHILGHSFNGSLHLWQRKKSGLGFEPRFTVSGHTQPVTDISWDHSGKKEKKKCF
jgi:hypothetical protein